MVHGL